MWELFNRIDELSCKIENAANVVELVAADITDNCQSGALWLARDVLSGISDELSELSSTGIALNKQMTETTKKKK